MLKKILIGLLCAVVLLVIVGFLLPAKIELTKSIVVNAPPEYVFEEVNSLEQWGKWSYWFSLDSTMQVTYGDKREGAGATYAWTSENLGNGKAAIAESIPYSTIKANLNFMEEDTSRAWYNFDPEGDGTRVTMGFSSDFGANPIGRWIGTLFIKPEIEKSFDHGLNKLKELAEAKPKFAVPISLEESAPFYYTGLSHTMRPDDPAAVVAQFDKMYTELSGALAKAGVEHLGSHLAFFASYTEASMEFTAALAVPEGLKLPSKYPVVMNPGTRVVKAISMGDYANLGVTHAEVDKFMAHKKLEVSGMPWEVYVAGPGNEPDTAKWITEVYYPVE